MNETPHPAVVARRRRLHQLRVRIATGAVALFIAVFSVIYAEKPATAKVTTVQKTGSTSSATSASSSPTPMTTSQS
jgi:hypothetical protein